VRDLASLEAAFDGADVVYHLAAKISIVGDPDGSVEAINVQGAENVARACLSAGVRRLVHCSSCHAFDINTPEPVDETRGGAGPGHPTYDQSKFRGEERVRALVAEGLDAVIVNPSGVIGPNDPEPSRMGHTLLGFARRTMPSMIDGGFDFVDVRDVVSSIVAASERGRTGENYLLGGYWTHVRELAGYVEELTGARAPAFTSPMWLAQVGAPFFSLWHALTGMEPLYTGEALHALRATRQLSHAKAERELGHAPRPVRDSVHDALRDFADRGLIELPGG
jgi:dihydroflavonol-4-reductase